MGARRIEYKTPAQQAVMRRSGRLLADVLAEVRSAIAPGATPLDLDRLAEDRIRGAGATPNFKGYQGFPATLCVSVNDVIVHGIPGERPFEDGDVVSIDGGCIVDGWHSDSAVTAIAGTTRSPADDELIRVTEDALWAGIAAAATAKRVGEIGAAIEDHVARAAGDRLRPLEDFGGHGIGTAMHQPPSVMNYRVRDRGPRLRPGMCLAIEPMLVQGDADWEQLDDGWTIVARSGRRAAHFEHSVAIAEDGVCVLTAADGGAERLAPHGIVPVALDGPRRAGRG